MVSPAAIAILLAISTSPALAQRGRPAPQEGPWDVALGVGAIMRPTFEGSDRTRYRPVPLISIKWRDTISFGEGGLNAYWHHRNFRIGGGLTYNFGREDGDSGRLFGNGDNRLAGLGKIDKALGLRVFASQRLAFINFDVAATKFTGANNKGTEMNFGASVPLPLGGKFMVSPHVRATWANDAYMQTYFGVTPLQASRSIFPAFNAGAGVKDVQGGVNLVYRMNRHWFLLGDVSVTRLMGDAARSPISISDTSIGAMTMIGYRF
jgi:outer membrane scaffolding protein for murein synthesis (MipA/OmpV family)